MASLAVAPVVGLATVLVWVARYASVASIVAALGAPVLAVAFGEPWPVIVFSFAVLPPGERAPAAGRYREPLPRSGGARV